MDLFLAERADCLEKAEGRSEKHSSEICLFPPYLLFGLFALLQTVGLQGTVFGYITHFAKHFVSE